MGNLMIRAFVTKLVLIMTLACAAVSPAFALDRLLTPEEEQLITEINEHNTAIRTMAGRFLQIDTFGNREEGIFFLERPDKVSFRYGPPSRQEIVSVGKGFYVVDRKEDTQYAYPQESVPLRQFLADEINLFNADIVDVVSTDNFISVSIADDTPAGTVEVALIFDIETKDLAQWTLTEPSGAELTFSVYDVEKNIELPKSLFSIKATRGSSTNN
jgi:outer membrane lipoprotein-sorting protein